MLRIALKALLNSKLQIIWQSSTFFYFINKFGILIKPIALKNVIVRLLPKCYEHITRTIKGICLSHFLLFLPACGSQAGLLHPRQISNSLYRNRASASYKTLYTLTCYLLAINFVPLLLVSLARDAARHSYITGYREPAAGSRMYCRAVISKNDFS